MASDINPKLALKLEPEATHRAQSQVIRTSGNAYLDQLAERTGDTYRRAGDAAVVSFVSKNAFDLAAQVRLEGRDGLRAGLIDFDGSWGSAPTLEGQHWFGTDNLGRDLYARTLHGGRISLLVGLVATLVSLGIGVAYGAIAGYVGGRVDQLMMRIVDVLYALPFMFFVILLMVTFGRNIILIFLAIAFALMVSTSELLREYASITVKPPRKKRK